MFPSQGDSFVPPNTEHVRAQIFNLHGAKSRTVSHEFVSLDMGMVQQIETMYYTRVEVRAALHLISSRVFSNGLSLHTSSTMEQQLHPMFRSDLELSFTSLGKDLLLSLLMYGVGVVLLTPSKTMLATPTIIPIKECGMEVSHTDPRQLYIRCKDPRLVPHDKNILYFVNSPPTKHGKVTSTLATLLTDYYNMSFKLKVYSQLSQMASSQQLIIHRHMTSNTPESDNREKKEAGHVEGIYPFPNLSSSGRVDSRVANCHDIGTRLGMYRSIGASSSALHDTRRDVRSTGSQGGGDSPSHHNNPPTPEFPVGRMDSIASINTDILTINEGFQARLLPNVSLPPDGIGEREHFQRVVLRALRIPEHIFLSVNKSFKTDTALYENEMNATVQSWGEIVEASINKVTMHIYGMNMTSNSDPTLLMHYRVHYNPNTHNRYNPMQRLQLNKEREFLYNHYTQSVNEWTLSDLNITQTHLKGIWKDAHMCFSRTSPPSRKPNRKSRHTRGTINPRRLRKMQFFAIRGNRSGVGCRSSRGGDSSSTPSGNVSNTNIKAVNNSDHVYDRGCKKTGRRTDPVHEFQSDPGMTMGYINDRFPWVDPRCVTTTRIYKGASPRSRKVFLVKVFNLAHVCALEKYKQIHTQSMHAVIGTDTVKQTTTLNPTGKLNHTTDIDIPESYLYIRLNSLKTLNQHRDIEILQNDIHILKLKGEYSKLCNHS